MCPRDGVVVWNHSVVLWVAPPYNGSEIVSTILLDVVHWIQWRGRWAYGERIKYYAFTPNCSLYASGTLSTINLH